MFDGSFLLALVWEEVSLDVSVERNQPIRGSLARLLNSDFPSVMGKPNGMIHGWKIIILGRQ